MPDAFRQQARIQLPEPGRLAQVFAYQASQPGFIRCFLLFQRFRETLSLADGKRGQVFVHQHVNDGLADHLPLLIPENRDRGNIGFESVLCAFSQLNALAPDGPGHGIRAGHRLNEAILASDEVSRQIDVAGDCGPDGIKLSAQLTLRRTREVRHCERDTLAKRRLRFESDILARPIHGDACLWHALERLIHIPKRFLAMNDDVRVHHKKDIGFPRRELMHEAIPRIELAAFREVGDPAGKAFPVRMLAGLDCEIVGRDLWSAVGATVDDADYLAAQVAMAQFGEERLGEKRLQHWLDAAFLVPGENRQRNSVVGDRIHALKQRISARAD